MDGSTNSLLLTVEYKPPHKLSVETLRTGLRSMEMWEEMVNCNTVPTDPVEKLRYNAKRLVDSAIVQTYDVMIEEGRADAILTNGLARVLLHVPYDDPATLLYHFCEPHTEIDEEDLQNLRHPNTSIARVFDHTRSLIPDEELRKTPPYSESNFPTSFAVTGLIRLRFKPNNTAQTWLQPSHIFPVYPTSSSSTQACDVYLGLKSGGALDDRCPNVMLHRRSKDDIQHRITSEDLVRLFKAQLDENIDRCTPLRGCGAYGAPFKLTCIQYGFTVVGKGTTSALWKEVSREAEVYRILQRAQGSAVPVFLGSIDLAKIYFLHGAGEIRHMLVMAWGGESTTSMELTPKLLQRIHRSNRKIRALGIIHEDLRRDNVLWNEELRRALIIDFHRSTLKCRPTLQRPRASKRQLAGES
ncbi:hypothetical protein N7508_009386 [Penicillium antarcticum]|uniref:uncharacterized protein n=1 Tax=Penicillium antarcticum TaxID=416450 RepID=UPI00239793E7|nr:uncharacterized protein N7508_009386 [Penicillium antarcticum]KAJ5294565.1 hypothetical protein N7508_009386 [Penicillium antarcticum]